MTSRNREIIISASKTILCDGLYPIVNDCETDDESIIDVICWSNDVCCTYCKLSAKCIKGDLDSGNLIKLTTLNS